MVWIRRGSSPVSLAAERRNIAIRRVVPLLSARPPQWPPIAPIRHSARLRPVLRFPIRSISAFDARNTVAAHPPSLPRDSTHPGDSFHETPNVYALQEARLVPLRQFPALDSNQTLVLVFGAPSYRDAGNVVGDLARDYPKSHVVGCSTSGEIFDTSLSDDTLSVAVAAFEGAGARNASASVRSAADSFAAGQSIANELFDKELRGVLVLSDGLNVNGSELIKGLNTVLPESVVVTGGLAGDGARFQATWVISEGRPQSNLVTAVGFYGDRVQIGHGSKGGSGHLRPRATGDEVQQQCPLRTRRQAGVDLYKSYLGDRASELPASGLLFPLALRQCWRRQTDRSYLACHR